MYVAARTVLAAAVPPARSSRALSSAASSSLCVSAVHGASVTSAGSTLHAAAIPVNAASSASLHEAGSGTVAVRSGCAAGLLHGLSAAHQVRKKLFFRKARFRLDASVKRPYWRKRKAT